MQCMSVDSAHWAIKSIQCFPKPLEFSELPPSKGTWSLEKLVCFMSPKSKLGKHRDSLRHAWTNWSEQHLLLTLCERAAWIDPKGEGQPCYRESCIGECAWGWARVHDAQAAETGVVLSPPAFLWNSSCWYICLDSSDCVCILELSSTSTILLTTCTDVLPDIVGQLISPVTSHKTRPCTSFFFVQHIIFVHSRCTRIVFASSV